MSPDMAERWVVISALVVAGVYAYQRLAAGGQTQPKASLQSIVGAEKPPAALGAFVTAWGFTFLTVSILATANPELGAAFAILIMTADLLTNLPAITGIVGKRANLPVTPTPAGPAAAANVAGSQAAAAVAQTAAEQAALDAAGSIVL